MGLNGTIDSPALYRATTAPLRHYWLYLESECTRVSHTCSPLILGHKTPLNLLHLKCRCPKKMWDRQFFLLHKTLSISSTPPGFEGQLHVCVDSQLNWTCHNQTTLSSPSPLSHVSTTLTCPVTHMSGHQTNGHFHLLTAGVVFYTSLTRHWWSDGDTS